MDPPVLQADRDTGNAISEILASPPQGSQAEQISGSQSSELAAPAQADTPVPQTEAEGLLPASSAHQISFQLAGAGANKVNVLFTEKDGKVDVAVRTPDLDLARSLQSDLGDLVDRLDHSGYKTVAWIPSSAHPTAAAAGWSSGSGGDQNDSKHSGSWAGERQSQDGQNQSGQRPRPHWFEQLQETLSAEEDSKGESE